MTFALGRESILKTQFLRMRCYLSLPITDNFARVFISLTVIHESQYFSLFIANSHQHAVLIERRIFTTRSLSMNS